MAGNRFAEWLYDCVDADEEEEWVNCYLAPVPMRWGRRVMLSYPDRLELVRYPDEELARTAYRMAAERLWTATFEEWAIWRQLADAEAEAEAS